MSAQIVNLDDYRPLRTVTFPQIKRIVDQSAQDYATHLKMIELKERLTPEEDISQNIFFWKYLIVLSCGIMMFIIGYMISGLN